MKLRGTAIVTALVVAGAATGGCGRETTASTKPAGETEAAERPLHIAMSAAFVSEKGVPVYDEIVAYLKGRLGRDVEFVTGLGYETINQMITSGDVDAGFVCGLPYTLLKDREVPAAVLIAAPVMKDPRYQGKPVYYADLVVRKDSPFRSLDDLRGKRYVYNEEISNSGYNLPRFRLIEKGETGGFFGSVSRSGSHEESMRMVAAGKADASYVDSLVLEYDQHHGHNGARDLHVIDSVGPAGIPPVVASSQLPEAQRNALRTALLHMHETPEGRAILDKALVDKFIDPGDATYDSIRQMHARAESTGFKTIR
jgi:phosphonate transport system substrate-binding protein